ncbi:branched-chain amino acid ABC transporter permease [Pseudonocardia sp. H11422]|uniref:branched-chain amino acid ABC transporter permease n=1 Tax=Pseudonocardia sp. H11422 TaxID=2835866 RepID=UPI001BDCD441|nr:carboxypeptidase regulatory-like domain-containing protein [Pseudonocardia sp. H11422]
MRRLMIVVLFFVIAALTVPSAVATAQEGEAVGGTLRGPDGRPVAGVTIMVEQDGREVGSATTGPDGSWQVPVPSPGNYDIALDVATLPEGVALRNADAATLPDVTVRPGQERTVLFPLTGPGEDAAGRPGDAPGPAPPPTGRAVTDVLAQLTVAGIKFGAIIAITAIGLSLIFGTTNLINFAHGELVTIGAVTAFFLNAAALGPGWDLIPSALIAIVVGALVGAALERGLWRPLQVRGTGRIQLFIISIGLSLFLRHILLVIFGSRPRPYADYVIQQVVVLGPIAFTPRDLVITVLALAVLVAVGLMLLRTRIGKAMRAVADDRDLAEASGVDVSRVVLYVWILGGGLAALGGVLFGLSEIVAWDMGFRLLLLMFAAVILGGLGSAFGAMAGGLLVGLVAQLSTAWFPVELQNAWALGILILVLLVRPQGIFGRAERVG